MICGYPHVWKHPFGALTHDFLDMGCMDIEHFRSLDHVRLAEAFHAGEKIYHSHAKSQERTLKGIKESPVQKTEFTSCSTDSGMTPAVRSGLKSGLHHHSLVPMYPSTLQASLVGFKLVSMETTSIWMEIRAAFQFQHIPTCSHYAQKTVAP